MNHPFPTAFASDFPCLVTVEDETGLVMNCTTCPPALLDTHRLAMVEAIEIIAEDHAAGAALFVPAAPRQATRAIYRLHTTPEILDPAVVDLAIRAGVADLVLWAKPAVVTVIPGSREERDFLAALRAHWSQRWHLPLIELDFATVAATRRAERNATPYADTLRCQPALMDYCIADEIEEDEETAERRATLCLIEGLDPASVEQGAFMICRRIADAILGTAANTEGLVV